MSSGLLEYAQNLVAGLLDLGRTRFELFSTELREELARLAVTLIGGLALLILAAFGVGFGAIALILGALVLLVPATIVGWKVQFFPFLIVDRGANAWQSLTVSWRMTDGHLFGLFVYWLLSIALVIGALLLGTLACLVGLIVTVPTALAVLALAQAHIYLKLTGEEPVLKAS